MYSRLIIYFGKPGLETEVFHSYMASLGYRVQVVSTCASATSALDATPGAIVVIAADQEPEEAVHHAESLHAHLKIDGRIFVISSAQSLDLRLSGVDFIPQPYRLSELVKRIRALTPDARPI
jgi:DNA-binding response OmpR family regulator